MPGESEHEAPGPLRRVLTPAGLWGLGVAYVISGMYFGWNLGLPLAGSAGFFAATLAATATYVAFVLGYAELACALPGAGGAFVYAGRAFGPFVGFLAGFAQALEFVFASPAIAVAIGAHANLALPWLHPSLAAAIAYLLFTALNAYGVRQSVAFGLWAAAFALAGLLAFALAAAPHVSLAALGADPLPAGWAGAFRALPYAVWFYLGIEGLANVAEEARDPQRDLPRGFGSAMATLVVAALVTFAGAVGVAGWRAAVFAPGSTEPSDAPLPLVIARAYGEHHPLHAALVALGLVGLVASCHGLVLVAGRALFALGREGLLPAALGRTHPRRATPVAALAANCAAGLLAVVSGTTGFLITLSVLSALTMYALALASLFALRAREPGLARPFRAPGHPALTALALALVLACLVAVASAHPREGALFAGVMAAGAAWFVARRRRARA
jgi:ethanolamine permease